MFNYRNAQTERSPTEEIYLLCRKTIGARPASGFEPMIFNTYEKQWEKNLKKDLTLSEIFFSIVIVLSKIGPAIQTINRNEN